MAAIFIQNSAPCNGPSWAKCTCARWCVPPRALWTCRRTGCVRHAAAARVVWRCACYVRGWPAACASVVVGLELWFLERYFVIINAALYGFVLWVLTLISPIEIAVLNLVTKVSDPHGSTADLDTHPTSHY